jgi:predicted transcriptional regulator
VLSRCLGQRSYNSQDKDKEYDTIASQAIRRQQTTIARQAIQQHKIKQNQATPEPRKIAKIKQNEAKYEQGFRLCLRIRSSNKITKNDAK